MTVIGNGTHQVSKANKKSVQPSPPWELPLAFNKRGTSLDEIRQTYYAKERPKGLQVEHIIRTEKFNAATLREHLIPRFSAQDSAHFHPAENLQMSIHCNFLPKDFAEQSQYRVSHDSIMHKINVTARGSYHSCSVRNGHERRVASSNGAFAIIWSLVGCVGISEHPSAATNVAMQICSWVL